MKVKVSFMGPLREYVGEDRVEFDLPGEATFGHALDEIGRRFGDRFPSRIWDSEAKGFKAGILTIGSGRDLDSRETRLTEGEEIKVLPMLGGG